MSNLYRLTDEQVRNYRDAVTYTAAQQPTTFVARDHDKLLDALSTPVSLPAPPEEMVRLWEAVSELERQVLSGIEKDIFISITDDIPPFVHINFDWVGTLAECLIAEAWKDDLETMKAALEWAKEA